VLAGPPLLSLGFMIAARSVLRGGVLHPRQFIEPLMGAAPQRRTLLLLCALYGAGMLLALLWVGWIYGDAADALRQAAAKHGLSSREAAEAALDPRLNQGMLTFVALASLLAIPFWHAPALVLWGGQGVWQSLFSSTIGMWRAKGAYFVYLSAWLFASLALSLTVSLLGGLLGAAAIVFPMALGFVFALATAFYVSLWFSFVDTFGSPDDDARPPSEQPAAAPDP
ncbi:MAG TPA: BPSS1780 family membrane protein, partial [Burkholderiaceae bacterium]|nr:BPSS1780 family membrane protein [Burkholderiaceae bacterium]